MTNANASDCPTIQNSQLEQFLLLAKGAHNGAAAALIEQAIKSNGVYVFGELLDMPNIISLKGTQYEKHLNLLKLFAFGTYRDFINNRDAYPTVSDAMIKKLRHLTVATMASKNRRISYTDLLNELGLDNRRELEDLIIDAIYADVVRGKLNQRDARLEVERSLARDVPEGNDSSTAITLLEQWCANCEAVLKTIETEADKADGRKVQHNERTVLLETKMTAVTRKPSIQEQFEDVCMQEDSKPPAKAEKA